MGLKASKYEEKRIECCANCINYGTDGSRLGICVIHFVNVKWNGICDDMEWRK